MRQTVLGVDGSTFDYNLFLLLLFMLTINVMDYFSDYHLMNKIN